MTKVSHGRVGRSCGVASVELVLVIPVYMIMIFGVAMIGHLGLTQGQAEVAARYAVWANAGSPAEVQGKFSGARGGSVTYTSVGVPAPSGDENGAKFDALNYGKIYEVMVYPYVPTVGVYIQGQDLNNAKDMMVEELPGWLAVRQSDVEVDFDAHLPIAGRIPTKKIKTRNVLVVPRGDPSTELRNPDPWVPVPQDPDHKIRELVLEKFGWTSY